MASKSAIKKANDALAKLGINEVDGMAGKTSLGRDGGITSATELAALTQEDTLPRQINRPGSEWSRPVPAHIPSAENIDPLSLEGSPLVVGNEFRRRPIHHAPQLPPGFTHEDLALLQQIKAQRAAQSNPHPQYAESVEDVNASDNDLLAIIQQQKLARQHTTPPATPVNLKPEKDFNPTGLLGKLTALKSEAEAQGKEVVLQGAASRKEYVEVFRKVLSFMQNNTGGMTVEMINGHLAAYWEDEDGRVVGFNRMHLFSDKTLGVSLMDPDNKLMEDSIVEIPFGDSLAEFQANVEDFFYNLYRRHVGI